MYFPTADKQAVWAEAMKDLKSRQVNDSTIPLWLHRVDRVARIDGNEANLAF